jgi:serine/threonine protein kinase
MSGTIKGKFGYMAPEYLAGRIDARADLFAVGVIAHELLTNRPLFSTGDDMQTLLRVRELQIEPPSRTNRLVPNDIDDIIMTALDRDPDRRWQHATALRNAMTTVTRRLGLHVESTRVVEWLEKFDFDQATEPRGRKKSRAYVDEFEVSGESMVISVEDAPQPSYDAVTAVGSQPPQELTTGSRNRAEYQAALAQYEHRERQPAIPRTVTPSSVASMAAQPGRSTGPNRTLIGVSGQIPIPMTTPGSGSIPVPKSPSGPISAQLPLANVRSSADMAAPRSAEIAATVPAPKKSRAGLVVLLVLLLLGGGAAAAYFTLL